MLLLGTCCAQEIFFDPIHLGKCFEPLQTAYNKNNTQRFWGVNFYGDKHINFAASLPNGQPENFVLDTGCKIVVLTSAFAEVNSESLKCNKKLLMAVDWTYFYVCLTKLHISSMVTIDVTIIVPGVHDFDANFLQFGFNALVAIELCIDFGAREIAISAGSFRDDFNIVRVQKQLRLLGLNDSEMVEYKALPESTRLAHEEMEKEGQAHLVFREPSSSLGLSERHFRYFHQARAKVKSRSCDNAKSTTQEGHSSCLR